ncbi:family 78 glycoside hydrolase catalytic domain [Granulosicoccus sp. 3-233]|uniref:alpha-L-rhamnosidase n=1 Tax=Granulosicoccus sp. 3-233 TaxID=3417969 RepID=UPI003D337E78
MDSEQTSPVAYREISRNWQAQMIAPLADAGQGSRASFVSTTFRATGSARLHVSAMGLYRAYLNGKRVGDDELTPGWTCYDDRIAYQSYDLTGLLVEGDNRIDIWLGDGWFRSQMLWDRQAIFNCWGDRIAAIAEIEVGDTLIAKTDNSWRSGLLPITASGIYHGEDFDARLANLIADQQVEALPFNTASLVPHETAPVKTMAPLAPIRIWEADGSRLYDFGQNIAGWVSFRTRGAAGAVIRVEHSEVLDGEGRFDNRNYRSARAECRYTLSGDDEQRYAPHFTFMGFRYARITVDGEAKVSDVLAVPVTSVPEQCGGFTCDIHAVNQLVENTIWSQRGNFIEIPTDCPQRDERLGWTGDAQVFAGTACWLADCERFFLKYLRDVMHDQRVDGAIPHFSPDPTRLHPDQLGEGWAGSTGWGDVITVMPWQHYLHYGDTAVLRDCYPAMRRWLDYVWSLGNGPIVKTRARREEPGFTFGDWLQPVGDNRLPRPTIAADCAATLYHYLSTDLTAVIAETIGEDSSELRERAARIRDAFAYEYIAPSGRLAHNDMTSYALATMCDLIPADKLEAARSCFAKVIEDADGLIGTGFIGTPALLPALSRLNLTAEAQQLFLNREVPGWLYQVEQGATTIWERWDAISPDGEIYDPEMNSYNHYSYGAVCQWLFEDVAGVKPRADGPGFNRVTLSPHILDRLGQVSMWHECRHGRISAAWSLNNHKVTYDIDLPDGCEGMLIRRHGQSGFTLDGVDVDLPEEGLSIASGAHTITFELA